jgi:Right handed beta helix region
MHRRPLRCRALNSSPTVVLAWLAAVVGIAAVAIILGVVAFGSKTPSGSAPASARQAGTPSAPAGTQGYVRPGTQGYRGAVSALTVYSAANGRKPAGSACSWDSGGILTCPDNNLTLDHAYIQGSLEWDGCGSLSISNSVVDWQPADGNWFSVYSACQSPSAGALITVTSSTFETAGDVAYTGMSDTGAISEYANSIPENISNSLLKDFPQGLDPAADSTIKDNEIYVANGLKCWLDHAQGTTAICHSDGIFNEGSSNNTYEGNYIDAGTGSSTAALFYQSGSPITGNQVIGNYIAGGAFTLYNQNATGLDVENNTFGGFLYGSCSIQSGASWGKWAGNTELDGTAVMPKGDGCN